MTWESHDLWTRVPMRKLTRSNLSEDAYKTLRELFIEGDRYNPGEKISVEELTRELGVSRTPLWGAIYRLEAEGIVDIVPRLGVFLVDYDPARVMDIYQAREALEGMAARLAAENVKEKQLEELKANIAQQRSYLEKDKIEKYHVVAIEFHEIIAKLSKSATLHRLLASIYAQIKAMRVQRNTLPPMHLPHSCDEHDSLLQAISRRDANEAEKIARSHIRDLTSQIRQQMWQSQKSEKAPSE